MEGRQGNMGAATSLERSRHLLRRTLSTVVQLLFPIECVGCGVEMTHFCASCQSRCLGTPLPAQCFACDTPWAATHACPTCQKNSLVTRLFWIGDFSSPALQRGIYALKYDFRRSIGNNFGQLLAGRLARIEPCTIVPVPLSRQRESYRGFNQAQVIAAAIAGVTGWRVRNDLVQRVRDTPPQAQRATPQQREVNVAHAFECTSTALREMSERILIVDDVWTTGSTMNAVAQVLKTNSAKEIFGAVVAKG